MAKKNLSEREKNVKKVFGNTTELKPKKGKTGDLPGMGDKDELYVAGEELFEARQGLSKAQAANEEAANNFIEVAKRLKKSSVTVKPEGEDPRTFKYEKESIKEKVTMRKEK